MTAPQNNLSLETRLDRRRSLYIASLIGIAVSLIFGVMLSVGLNEHGEPWVGGTEFLTDVTIMSVTAAMAAITGLAGALQGRRIRRVAATDWLYQESGVSLEPQTQRLRTLGRNAGFLAVFWIVVLLLAVSSLAAAGGGLDDVQLGVHVLFILVAIVAIPASLTAMANWARRYRSVRKTGWRAAKSVNVTTSSGREALMPMISIEFADGSTLDLRTIDSTYRVAHKEGRRLLEAWVGGTDTAMVVLFEEGRWRKGPYPVPVKGLVGRSPKPPKT